MRADQTLPSAPARSRARSLRRWGVPVLALAGLLLPAAAALAHGVADRDGAFLATNVGLAPGPYAYLGAKHMVTGYDHLLFLAGVIFFLYRMRDVIAYVTLFAIGHSVTLLAGVLGGIHANPFLIDAVIGFSVAYKGFDNLGGLRAFGLSIDSRVAVLVFGLFHGFGLATKIQSVEIARGGLIGNIVAFNVGVEIGQILGLTFLLLLIHAWRASGRFQRHAFVANSLLVVAGFVLVGHQLTGYLLS
ncbi:MAG TPA: HupE/UreJ family protein [Thermoanaerobaculia bacterium]|nr:HupE/UreJ family protein [Thermoanaerobaculia bacterium]